MASPYLMCLTLPTLFPSPSTISMLLKREGIILGKRVAESLTVPQSFFAGTFNSKSKLTTFTIFKLTNKTKIQFLHLPMEISCPALCTLNKNSRGKNLSYCYAYSSSLSIQKKKRLISCRCNGNEGWAKGVRVGALAVAAALQLQLQVLCGTGNASEFDILNGPPPKEGETYVVDDAGVMNRVTKADIKRLLFDLETRKGYHINCITLRKLTSKADAYEFADALVERWYPSVEEGNKKGVVLLVTSQKEGAVTGGPAFIQAVGDQVLEGVVSQNLPVLATDEKYNEAMFSTAKRLVAAIDELPDPGGPMFEDKKRESNFKTREETEEKRGQFITVVGGLLVIAFVVPMVQYYAYVSKK